MRQKFRIRRPNHCNAQRVALSTYKNTHTLKTMNGITPSGFRQCQLPGICGRSTYHRQTHITERLHVFSWQIWELLLWTYIYSPVKTYVQVNTPTTLKGRSQLDQQWCVTDEMLLNEFTSKGSLDVPKPSKLWRQLLSQFSCTAFHNENSVTVMISKLIQNKN